jgi:AAA domain
MKLEDVTPFSRYFMITGESGAGKSIQAGSFPQPYFFDLDNRLSALANFYRGVKSDIEGDTYSDFEKMTAKLESFTTRCHHKTIVIDTSTYLIQLMLRYIDKMKGGSGKSGKDFGMSMKLGIISIPALDDFRYLVNGMIQLIERMVKIQNVFVVMNAHLMTGVTDKSEGVSRSILAPAATASHLPTRFDEIYYLFVQPPITSKETTRRLINTAHDGENFARTSMKLPHRLDVTDELIYDQLCKHVDYYRQFQTRRVMA